MPRGRGQERPRPLTLHLVRGDLGCAGVRVRVRVKARVRDRSV